MRNRGRLFSSYDWTRSFHVPAGIQSTGIKTGICPAPPLFSGLNNCRTLSCSGIAYSILFLILIARLWSLTGRFRISILPHCDAGHWISVSPKDAQPGTVVLILRLNTDIPCPAGTQSTGIKTVICPAPALLSGLNKCLTLSCSGIALSFLFSFCHFLVSPDFSLWCRSVKSGIFDFNVVLWLSWISGRPFSSDAYLSLVGQLELLAKINVWQRDIRVDPEKSPLCE